MLRRFDICMAQLETGRAGDTDPTHPVGDQNPARRDKPHAEPIDAAQPLAKKNRAKHRDKHDA